MLTVNRQRIFKCLELLEEAGAAISRASLQLLEIPEFSAERDVLQTLKKTVREHWDEIFEKREKQLQPSTPQALFESTNGKD